MEKTIKSTSNIIRVAAASFVLLLVPLVSLQANTVYRSGEAVGVTAEQQVEGDFYTTAGTVSVSGEVQGDMYAVAGVATINGTIAADLFAVAGSVQLHGDVNDDVRIIGGETVISERVAGDVVVVGGMLQVLSTAEIEGDILMFAGDVTVAGSVGGDVLGAADRLRLDGPVGGQVDVHTTEFTLGEQAAIAGDVRYTALSEVRRAPGAVIEGELNRVEETMTVSFKEQLRWLLVPVLVLAFTTLLLYFFGRVPVTMLMEATRQRFWFNALLGTLVIVGLPIMAALLLSSVIGGLVGLLLFFAYIALMILTLALAPIVLGAWLYELITKQFLVSLTTVGLGVVVTALALMIPPVGILLLLLLQVALIGATIRYIYRELSL